MKLTPAKTSLFPKKSSSLLVIIGISLTISCFIGLTPASAQEAEKTTPATTNSANELASMGIIKATILPQHPQTESKYKFYYELTPGGSISDNLWLVNLVEDENNIQLYAVHGGFNDNGDIGYAIIKEDGTKELSKWTLLEYDNKPLKPKEQKLIPFTITIPDETPFGTYYGGFALERFIPAERGNLNSSFRKIFPIEVKVTDTPAEFRERTANVFEFPVYFWPALALFIISTAYYLISKYRTGNPKKNEK